MAIARELQAGLAAEGDHAALWDECLPLIRQAYPGELLDVQTGLVPLGPDPASGLWEFGVLESGVIPARDDEGHLVLTEDVAVVLILLPGGAFRMGSAEDPADPYYDPNARSGEWPAHTVELNAFFMSKFEMTQGQWLHLTGVNPSSGSPDGVEPVTLLHPVETVTWDDCVGVLARLGLELPTEAQWEYAARAGTLEARWMGPDVSDLEGYANVEDPGRRRSTTKALAKGADSTTDSASTRPWTCSHRTLGACTTSTGTSPNGAGTPTTSSSTPSPHPTIRSAKRPRPVHGSIRGGTFDNSPELVRSAYRGSGRRSITNHAFGVRPSRRIEVPR